MDFFKKILGLNDDSAIGLCKFSEEFCDLKNYKEQAKKRFKKETTLTQILKRSEA